MANELQNTLNDILNDKNTNLKPENLKQGVTCLGVEGTMEQPEPIYAVTDMKEKYNVTFTERIDFPNGITIYDDFIIARYKSKSSYSLWYKGKYITDFRISVIGASVDSRACVVLGYDDTYISVGTPYDMGDYSDTLRSVKINYITGEYVALPDKTLEYEVYYNENGNYYNKYIMLYNHDTRNKAMSFYDYDITTDTLTFMGYKSKVKDSMLNPEYILSGSRLVLYKLQTNENNLLDMTELNINQLVDGVSFDSSKIFIGGNVYVFNNGVGNLLSSSAYESTGSIFVAINDKYYIRSNTLYEFNNETNTFTEVGTGYRRRGSYLYTCDSTYDGGDSNYVTTFEYGEDLQNLIGIKYNNNNFYFVNNIGVSSNKILQGYIAYDKNNTVVTGTMPNNGDVTIAPTTSEQVKEKGYYNSLKVSAVTSAIDSNITPENIKKDISILGVTGTLEGGIDTSDANATASDIAIDKTAYVNGQKITGVIPEYKSNTELGEQYFIASKFDKTGDGSGLLISGRNSADGLFRTGTYLGVNIGTEEQSQLAELIGLTADKISEGNTILGVEGTAGAGGIDTSDATATVKDILAGKTAYVDGEKLEGTMANNGDLIITPNTDEQDHSAGYYNSIQVRPVTSSVDTNIKAENIKSGISILGVAGSVIELNGHELEVTPSTEQKVIEPEENYNAITRVTVEAVTSSIDPNITPENIKSGVSILGVTGTYNGEVLLSNQVPTSSPDKLTYAVVVNDGNYLGTYKYDPSSESGGTWEKLVETV